MFGLCRICLAGQAEFKVERRALLDVYESLTDFKFNSADGRPRSVCCYCYRKLNNCYIIMSMADRSNNIITQTIQQGATLDMTSNELMNQLKYRKKYLTQTPLRTVAIEETGIQPMTIKEEPIAIEDQDDVTITTEHDIKLSSLCRICLVEKATFNAKFLDVYRKLINSQINKDQFLNSLQQDVRPKSVCCYCHCKLRKCCNFSIMARASENLFTRMLQHGMINEIVDILKHKKLFLTKTPLQTVVIEKIKDVYPVTIKVEPHTQDGSANEGTSLIPIENIKEEIKSEPETKKITKRRKPKKNNDIKIEIKTGNGIVNIQVKPTKKPAKSATCKICNKDFVDKHRLKVHLKVHTGEKPYSCDVCGKKFSLKHHIPSHMRTHTGEKPYGCDVCNKHFTEKVHLKRHIKVHTGQLAQDIYYVKCELCNKKIDKNRLQKHARVHTGEKPFSCSECDKKFVSKYNLKIHLLAMHTDCKKPFACSMCDKSFLYKTHWKRHKCITYQCYCGLQFQNRSELSEHKGIHGERPFGCDICDLKFARKRHLRRHILLHAANTKQFPCVLCDKLFLRHRDMLLHTKDIHK